LAASKCSLSHACAGYRGKLRFVIPPAWDIRQSRPGDPLDEHGLGSHVEYAPGGEAHGGEVVDLEPGQSFGLRQVRGYEAGPGKEPFPQSAAGVLREERCSMLADHDRIDHHGESKLGRQFRHGLDDLLIA
jgi:hypothetical protein